MPVGQHKERKKEMKTRFVINFTILNFYFLYQPCGYVQNGIYKISCRRKLKLHIFPHSSRILCPSAKNVFWRTAKMSELVRKENSTKLSFKHSEAILTALGCPNNMCALFLQWSQLYSRASLSGFSFGMQLGEYYSKNIWVHFQSVQESEVDMVRFGHVKHVPQMFDRVVKVRWHCCCKMGSDKNE